MPVPVSDMLATPPDGPITFGLEPAYNGFNSLSLLNRAENLSGLDDWVTRTRASLSKERLHQHEVIFVGLYFAVEPARSFPSFPAYIDDIARQAPTALRDRVFETYARIAPCDQPTLSTESMDMATLLADRDVFLQYLTDRFSADHVIEPIETQAHALLNDPPRMRDEIVEHLRTMWETVLAPEWTRVTSMLQVCVDAYQPARLQRPVIRAGRRTHRRARADRRLAAED